MLKALRNIVIIVILFGVISAAIDYYLLKNYKKPIFCIVTYNEAKHTESYRGMFYQAKRITSNSNKEQIKESKFITYYLFLYPINIKINQDRSNKELSIIYKQAEECKNEPILYYKDKNNYIYTQCINEINIKQGSKEQVLKDYLKKESIDSIYNQLFFTGYKTTNYEIYTTDYSKKDLNLKIIKCTNTKENILYIVQNKFIELFEYCNINTHEVNSNN